MHVYHTQDYLQTATMINQVGDLVVDAEFFHVGHFLLTPPLCPFHPSFCVQVVARVVYSRCLLDY